MGGQINSKAGTHLKSCHGPHSLELDTSTGNDSFLVKTGHLIARVWSDHSLLLGQQRENGVAWYGLPFALERKLYPTDTLNKASSSRHLTLVSTGKRLKPEGSKDLVQAWDKSLKDAMQAWGFLLGPVPHCGAPHTSGLISPCFPFPEMSDEQKSCLEQLFTTVIQASGLSGNETTIVINGFEPGLTGWSDPHVEAWDSSYNQDEAITLAVNRITSLIKGPDFPYPKTWLIQEYAAEIPLLMITPGVASRHTIMEAHRAYGHFTNERTFP